jgi:Zn-dependent protease with chaperone function
MGVPVEQDSLAAFKISGGGGIARFFSTHPPLEERIAALQMVR